MTNLKIRKTLVALLFGMTAVLNSCVQEDWYELYEEDDLTLSIGRRKNKSDVGGVDYSAGPSVEDIISDYGVHNMMDVAWNTMLESCNENGRKEYGFRIYYKRNNGVITYSFSELISGDFVSWSSGTRPSINLGGNNIMDGAVICAVFHVHTSYRYAPSNLKRKTGLSQEDSASVSLFPTILFDYDGGEIRGGMEGSCPIIYSYDPRGN